MYVATELPSALIKLPRDSGTTVLSEPTIAKKEVVAEGSIPSADAIPELPKVELPNSVADTGNDLEGPVFPSNETTVNKPTVASYNDRFPTPVDEEAAQPINTNRNTLNAEAPQRDTLFERTNSSPLRTRTLETPAETDVPSLPRSRTRGFADDDYRERTQETLKPSTSGPSLRTADLTSSRESSFDRTSRDTDNNWGPVVAIFFFLLLSLGANFWLGWIALEARQRYQILLEKYRSVGGKTSVELV